MLGDQLRRQVVVQLGDIHPPGTVTSPPWTTQSSGRRERIEGAAEGRPDAAAVDAALERAREQVEALAAAAAELEASLPARVGDAVQDGLREQVLPVARNLAEIRGLMNQVIRRLERVEGDLLAERHARVDDLALLVDLVTAGWRSVEHRLPKSSRASTSAAAPSSTAWRSAAPPIRKRVSSLAQAPQSARADSGTREDP